MRLWFDSYSQTIYYKIRELKTNQPAYLTLFKISPDNELRALVQNQAIEVGRIYSYQDKSTEAGSVYFKTIVTSREIPYTQWFSLIDAKNTRQLKSILCVQSLTPLPENTTDNKIYRTALVIGNADYLKGPLNAPVLDAQALAKVLRKLGFQVREEINLDRKGMQNAIRAFGRELKQRPGVGLFYYSGHGVQDKGINYLIPIGATQSLKEAYDLPYETVLVNYVLEAMTEFDNPINLVFLDSCRTPANFVKSWAKGNTISPGMAKQSDVPGSLIAYAAAPGNPALDGKKGQNSPYVKQLLSWIQAPNLSIGDALTEVRKAVRKATKKQQQPQYLNALNDKFYFNSRAAPCPDCPEPDDLVAQLKRLSNPDAPLTVEMWLDKRGKSHFSRRNKVTINYEIKGLKKGTPAYLTLLNISPAGKLSMLFSESVAAGKMYGSWQTGQYVTSVKQTYLETQCH